MGGVGLNLDAGAEGGPAGQLEAVFAVGRGEDGQVGDSGGVGQGDKFHELAFGGGVAAGVDHDARDFYLLTQALGQFVYRRGPARIDIGQPVGEGREGHRVAEQFSLPLRQEVRVFGRKAGRVLFSR